MKQGEKKLLNALRVAYEDGVITEVERDTINSIAMQQEISKERIRELQSKVAKELGITADTISTDAPAVSEEKLLNALRVALHDGIITDTERDRIKSIAIQEGIHEDRFLALEQVVKDELPPIVREVKETENIADKATDEDKVNSAKQEDLEHEAPKDWPKIGFDFLQKVQTSIEPNLPFDPQARSDNTDIENDFWAWWHCNPKHYFAVSLVGKRTPNVSIEWGFYSEHEKRDPLLRKIATYIQEHSVILDAEEEDEADLEKDHYQFLPDNQLCVIADRRIKISELSNSNLIDDISNEFIDFIKKVWPIISSRYKEEEG